MIRGKSCRGVSHADCHPGTIWHSNKMVVDFKCNGSVEITGILCHVVHNLIQKITKGTDRVRDVGNAGKGKIDAGRAMR